MTQFKSKTLKLYNTNRRFVSMVIVPFVLFTIYTVLLPEQYTSTTEFIIKSPTSEAVSTFGGILSLPAKESSDAHILKKYISSIEMFNDINDDYNLKGEYASVDTPLHNRLSNTAKIDELLDLFNNNMIVDIEQDTGILTISYTSPSSTRSQEILEYVLASSSNYIDAFNKQTISPEIKFFKSQTNNSKIELNKAKNALIEYNNVNQSISPTTTLGKYQLFITELEKDLSAKELNLEAKKVYLNGNNIVIKNLIHEISSIKNKIKSLENKLVGNSGSINANIADHDELLRQIEFLSEIYKQNLLLQNDIIVSSTKKLKSLAIITHPFNPDYSSHPKYVSLLSNALLILLLFYGILVISIETIKDHKD